MRKPDIKLTKNQREFLRILREYEWIADRGNIAMEVDIGNGAVQRIARQLETLGLITVSKTDFPGLEGWVYEATKQGKEIAR